MRLRSDRGATAGVRRKFGFCRERLLLRILNSQPVCGMLPAMFLRVAALLLLALAVAAPLSAQCVPYTFPMGSGCGYTTPWGIPVASCSGTPSIGNASFGFTTTAPCIGVPVAGVLLVGFCRPTPLLFTSGATSGLCVSEAVCALHVNPVVFLTGLPQAGGFAFTAPIPNSPQLVGLQLCVQGAHTCSGLPCLSGTNAVRVTLF